MLYKRISESADTRRTNEHPKTRNGRKTPKTRNNNATKIRKQLPTKCNIIQQKPMMSSVFSCTALYAPADCELHCDHDE